MYLQLPEVEAARLKRTPAANPDAEDLALQCQAAFPKNEATFLVTYYRLCDQALVADPNNVRALTYLAITFSCLPAAAATARTTTSSGPTNWCRKR
jgi:hypothetical protein